MFEREVDAIVICRRCVADGGDDKVGLVLSLFHSHRNHRALEPVLGLVWPTGRIARDHENARLLSLNERFNGFDTHLAEAQYSGVHGAVLLGAMHRGPWWPT